MVSLAKRFCLSQGLPEAEGAARAEPSLLELCRVASEEDEVNGQKYIGIIFFCIINKKMNNMSVTPPFKNGMERWMDCELMQQSE